MTVRLNHLRISKSHANNPKIDVAYELSLGQYRQDMVEFESQYGGAHYSGVCFVSPSDNS